MSFELKRVDPFRLRLEAVPRRGVGATVYLPEGIEAERGALEQLRDVSTIDPASIVLATPDLHTGYGVPIGSVFASPRYVSPAAVGYDINCGMRLLTTPLRAAETDVVALAASIRRDIPLGEGQQNIAVSARSLERLLSGGVPALAEVARVEHALARAVSEEELADDVARIEDGGAMKAVLAAVPARAVARGRAQLATLGGGNHFVELQRVERTYDAERARAFGLFEEQLVVMLHSGSRGLGHEIGGHYMKAASEHCRAQRLELPSKSLAYMPVDSEAGRAYLGGMSAAANYAFVNRQLMAQLVRRSLRHRHGEIGIPTLYDVPHNIAKFERHEGDTYCVHRKGATRAFPSERMRGTPFEETGQPVLIPGSMGTASYVLAGTLSGRESLFSVNHGAGRVMSRTAAGGVTRRGRVLKRGVITDRAFEESMRGVHLVCADPAAIKEEAPAAYKDIDLVVRTVVGAGLASLVARLVPLAVLKG